MSMLAMGTSPHFLASALLGVVAQRLVRTLCPKFRVMDDVEESRKLFADVACLLSEEDGHALHGPGACPHCDEEGYVGRTGVFEIMLATHGIRRLVAMSRSKGEIEQQAIENGMIEFRRSALLRIAQGTTSVEEVLRAVPSEILGLDQ